MASGSSGIPFAKLQFSQNTSNFKPLQTPKPNREVQKMDKTENQNQKSLSQFIKSQFHRELTQLLLSVSVFSLFFSHSYWLSLLHSFSFNLHNTLPFRLFSHAIDKNCIFLLCNGLLVFLAKYSGLISSSSKYNLSDDQSFKSYGDVPQSKSIVLEPAPLLEKEVALESDEAVENSTVMEGRQEEEEEEEEAAAEIETETENFTMEEEEDEEQWVLMTSGEEEEENSAFVGEDEGEFLVQEFAESKNYDREEAEEEIELVEGNRVLSTEELSKKFDEFIRKMKEELRIEARQQLVMV